MCEIRLFFFSQIESIKFPLTRVLRECHVLPSDKKSSPLGLILTGQGLHAIKTSPLHDVSLEQAVPKVEFEPTDVKKLYPLVQIKLYPS
jgi:hypothetical protein